MVTRYLTSILSSRKGICVKAQTKCSAQRIALSLYLGLYEVFEPSGSEAVLVSGYAPSRLTHCETRHVIETLKSILLIRVVVKAIFL